MSARSRRVGSTRSRSAMASPRASQPGAARSASISGDVNSAACRAASPATPGSAVAWACTSRSTDPVPLRCREVAIDAVADRIHRGLHRVVL